MTKKYTKENNYNHLVLEDGSIVSLGFKITGTIVFHLKEENNTLTIYRRNY
jgi:hypothetical protein